MINQSIFKDRGRYSKSWKLIRKSLIVMVGTQVQSEKRKLEQEVIGLNERSRQQDEDNERLKSEITFLRYMVMVVLVIRGLTRHFLAQVSE